MAPWHENVAFPGISKQLLSRNYPEPDYGMDDGSGYKTEWSDEETIYEATLRSYPVPYSHYGAQFMCQSSVTTQGYKCPQQSEDAFSWYGASHVEMTADADCLMPAMGSLGAQSKGMELTRTQRRRAERRRAEQRRRAEFAKSDAPENEASNSPPCEQGSCAEASAQCATTNTREGSEITRTQRRRLQRRRAEQRLQMEMQQRFGEEGYDADGPISPHLRRKNERRAAREAEQKQRDDQFDGPGGGEIPISKFPDTSMPLTQKISEGGSTCGRSSCSTRSFCDDVSSTPSEPDVMHEDEENSKWSINDLMKWRPFVKMSEGSEVHLNAYHVEDSCSASDIRKSLQDEDVSLKSSANSWAARQACRRDSDQDEEIVRRMKSILNKLTVEKFPILSKQLISCGIETTARLESLVGEIVAKATTQHHFINMYADLCAMLNAQPSNSDSNRNIKKLLLNACQATFERHLAMLSALDAEDSEEAEQQYKLQMIGNIKFIGALLVRKMLASKVMFYIFEELLSQASLPEALECFVALLAAVGPEFDHPHNQGLAKIFDQAEAISNDAKVTPRIRYLFKDVLDLRASGWKDSKPKALERPSTLEEVAQKFHADAHTKNSSQSERWAPADSVNSQEKFGKRQPIVVEDSFDKAAMHKEIASVFADMLRSRDVRKAVSRIATIGVPPHVQVEQLRDLLQFMTEMKVECVRALGFEFIVTIFIEHYWMPSAFEEGFLNFARLMVDRKAETPALTKVIQDEMIPAFLPLVNRGILSSSVVQDLLRRLR